MTKAEETCTKWKSLFSETETTEDASQEEQLETICPSCDGSGENAYASNGEGICKECHGRGTVA